ncbi:MAG TPA: hypothetical protein VK790_06460 [Solirubrobacteraceae bacterium]|nr:hypothetical protein [Solirubrobacteraceae bacterium]
MCRRACAGSRARCTQIVYQPFDIFRCESQGLGSAASVPPQVREPLVLYVAPQRIAYDFALCLSGRAGEGFSLYNEIVWDGY